MTGYKDYKAQLENMVKTMTTAIEEDRDMPIQRALILFEIALHPGIRQNDLEAREAFSHASVSRNVAALTKWRRKGEEGLNYVESIQDPEDRNFNLLFLTVKGRNRMELVLSEIMGRKIKMENTLASEHLKAAHAEEAE